MLSLRGALGLHLLPGAERRLLPAACFFSTLCYDAQFSITKKLLISGERAIFIKSYTALSTTIRKGRCQNPICPMPSQSTKEVS